MDETGVWSNDFSLYTYTRKSNPKPWIKEMQGNNKRDTFVACISFDGEKIPIFGMEHQHKRYQKRKGEKVLKDHGYGGINLFLMKNWIQNFLCTGKK